MARRPKELRDLVFDEIVKEANVNEAFKAVVEPLGFFTFMRLVDGIVDAVVRAQEADAAALSSLAGEEQHRG